MPAHVLAAAKVRRLGRLLNMMYKPGEIAREIGVTDETIMRSYVPAGAPVTVDAKGVTWINGQDFAEWARDYIASRNNKPKAIMSASQGYCFHCRKVVEIDGLRRKPARRNVDMIMGRCAACGGKICRFSSAEKVAK